MTTTMDDHTAYTTAIEAWRTEQEARLRSEIGWLTVVGLCWLDEGVNTIGSDPSGAVVLPERLPAQLGVITLTEGAATLHITADADVLIDGVPSREAVLYYEGEHITLVQIDGVTFFVIKRGERLALRVRDVESAARRTFGGRQWFPVDPAYRVVGTFHAHPDGRQIEVETVIGTTVIYRNPGVVTFELYGTPQQLEVFDEGDDLLWLVLRDGTSGSTTYGAARFLYAPLQADNIVDLDFNKAVSPPCAFTPYATCPLAPKENHLPIPIYAGEKLP